MNKQVIQVQDKLYIVHRTITEAQVNGNIEVQKDVEKKEELIKPSTYGISTMWTNTERMKVTLDNLATELKSPALTESVALLNEDLDEVLGELSDLLALTESPKKIKKSHYVKVLRRIKGRFKKIVSSLNNKISHNRISKI